jgi:hypothetical protein
LLFLRRKFREKLEKKERRFENYIAALHCWIDLIYGYIIHHNILYNLIRGVIIIDICLIVATNTIILKKPTSGQPLSSACFSSFNHWIHLRLDNEVCPCVFSLLIDGDWSKMFFLNNGSSFSR